jgi:hypothetical protein
LLQASQAKTVSKTSSQWKKARSGAIHKLWKKAQKRWMVVQVGWSRKQDPISKINRAKRAGGMVQVVEHLPRKLKVLSSKSRTTKKKSDS